MEVGWHPDPWARHEHRYHDGDGWTEHVADAGVAAVDPPGGQPPSVGDDEDDAGDGVGGGRVSRRRVEQIRRLLGLPDDAGEDLVRVERAALLRDPGGDMLAVTDHRVVLLQGRSVMWEALLDGLAVAGTSGSTLQSDRLELRSHGKASVSVPLPAAEAVELATFLVGLGAAEAPLQPEPADDDDDDGEEYLPVYAGRLNRKTRRSIESLSHDGELPWLVIAPAGAGALAAWQDRLAIVKTGAVTGFMAGATFGGREAVFHFTDITAIEYNVGMLNGVLEVLTASYQGSQNKDFWRGVTSGNRGQQNPFALSNTLPLEKATYRNVTPQLRDLRRMIARAKQPQVHVTIDQQDVAPPAPAVAGLADQLRDLAALHEKGVLTDDEFAAAKQRMIEGG